VTAGPRPVIWSVAGSDSGAGAGIQADLKAGQAFGVHVCTAIAAITAQHSQAVARVQAVDADLLDAQLAALAEDLPPAAIKTGMLGSADNVRVLARWVRRLRERAPLALVVDPVLRATTGAALADAGLQAALRDELLPLADLATPNQREAALLAGRPEGCPADELAAAWRALGPRAVAITGGDAPDADGRVHDWIDTPLARGWLSLPRVATRHHHGTGCVFATSAAAALAMGFPDADALVWAKMATARALKSGYAAGAGAGPVAPQPGFQAEADLLPTLGLPGGSDAGAAFPSAAPSAPRPFAALHEPELGVYAVVDSAEWVARVLQAGVRTVQLRIKDPDHPQLREQIAASIRAAQAAGAQLFINDHWQAALELGAYGVHLGQEDLQTADLPALQRAGLRLGLSSHAPWEVCRALAVRPSYVACGPVRQTDSKAMPWKPQGFGNLAYWARLLPLPVVAIGGLDADGVERAARAGAASAAVIRALTQAPDLPAAAQALHRAWQRGREAAQAGLSVAPDWPASTLAQPPR
jgi:hydroxymethylpyrimidine kinase/phosphomethylpyrimidine kinase/thiamine-phosphate diphosphorylase